MASSFTSHATFKDYRNILVVRSLQRNEELVTTLAKVLDSKQNVAIGDTSPRLPQRSHIPCGYLLQSSFVQELAKAPLQFCAYISLRFYGAFEEGALAGVGGRTLSPIHGR